MDLKYIKWFIKNWILPPAIYSSLKGPDNHTESSFVDKSVDNITRLGEIVKDRHVGERCFILGGGSSVKQQDLKILTGENVISVSNTFVHKDYYLFKPKYHILPHILFGHSGHYSEVKFVEWLKEMDEKIFDAEMFMHWGDKKFVENNQLFKNRKIHWVEYCPWNGDFNTPIDPGRIPHIWSVSELAITLAMYMGFNKIYLLGFDHDWFVGPLVYFYDVQKEHKIQPVKENLSFADSEFQMRRHADIFKKYKYLYSMKKNIFNANANQDSYVDVFPKVKFESLFDK